MKPSASLNMDMAYSRAFIGAAIESGRAKVDDHQYQLLSAGKGGDLGKLLVDHRSTNRLKPVALEMALIFDQVHLFGLPSLINLDELKREGIVGLTMGQTASIKGATLVPEEFVRTTKPWVIRSSLARTNSALRDMGDPIVSYKVASRAYDSVGLACEMGVDLWELTRTFDRMLKDTDKRRVLAELDPEHLKIVWMMFELVKKSGAPDRAIVVSLMSALSAISYTWTLTLISELTSSPFLTNSFRTKAQVKFDTHSEAHGVFKLCQIEMRNDLGYAPVVEDFDDLLRLRNHKSIVRFRELLFEWCKLLPSGEAKVLSKMQTDIQKANKELRRLDKWKTVDRWVFWAQLPTILLPLLSTVVTLASFPTRLKVERTESVNSWVGIGRS